MRNIILAFTTVLAFSLTTQAQLKVVENEPREEIGAVKPMGQMTAEVVKTGDIYTVMYKDTKFIHLSEFKSYSMNEESFNQLYDLIVENWKNPPKEDIMLEFEDGYLWLSYTKMMGITSFRFAHSTGNGVFGFSPWFTKKQRDRLFGRS